jgi:4'-phosphopantetheinyl transferase
MDVYWLEQTEANLPKENEWLSENETLTIAGLRFAKRRADWLLGRWTAKRALSSCLNLPSDLGTLSGIEIRPAPSGAPEVFISNQPATATISLSHRAGRAACAVALGRLALGCDLELVEPRSEAFVADYFTAAEQVLVQRASMEARAGVVTLLWSAKESALKALSTGLQLDTRSVVVSPLDENGNAAATVCWDPWPLAPSPLLNCWKPLQVRHTDDRDFHGWWLMANDLIRTVVAAPPPAAPTVLRE